MGQGPFTIALALSEAASPTASRESAIASDPAPFAPSGSAGETASRSVGGRRRRIVIDANLAAALGMTGESPELSRDGF